MKVQLEKKVKFIDDIFNDMTGYNKDEIINDVKSMISAIVNVKESGRYALSDFIDNLSYDDYISTIYKSDMCIDDKRKFILQHHLYQYLLNLFIDDSILGKDIKFDLMGDL